MGSFVNFHTDMTNDKSITFMLDTGADASIFKRESIDPRQIIYPNKCAEIKGVTEGIVKTLGTTIATVFNEQFKISHEFHVVNYGFPIPCDAILGLDFIRRFKCILDYDRSVLIFNFGDNVHEIPISNCIEQDTLIIPPRCQIVKKVNIDELKVDSVVHALEIAPGVHVARTIISPSNTKILIINTTQETVVVKNPKLTTQPISQFHVRSIKTVNQDTRFQTILSKFKKDMPHYVQEKLFSLCEEFADIFALQDDILTHNNFYEQKLTLADESPVYVKPYRLPQSQRQEVKRQVDLLKQKDLIEPSRSPFNSPLILVPKKSENPSEKSWRLVVDFREVNKKLVQDKFPLPRIDMILDELGRAKWFSVVDLMSGFHQIPLEENSRNYTSFSIEGASYRFKRLPFGLNVSCNSFQRMMTMAFSGLPPDVAFLYVDDVIITGCSERHHLQNLRKVFEVCRNSNLKLNPSKCQFFKNEVTYLGHHISEKGVLPDPAKFHAIKNFPTPKNADEVKRLVAFCNYYRRFIRNFAEITYPLNQLTRKGIQFEWTTECNNAFLQLKDALINPPILQYPDFSKTFILSTDASNIACGAVLSQEHDGSELPIAFASKKFTKGESNKSTIEKELAAIHWAITYFKPYLYGRKFIVKSDHRPLVYLFSMKNPTSKLTRIRLELQDYDFQIIYIKGVHNTGPDALSRVDIEELKALNINIAKIVTRAQTRKEKFLNETDQTMKDTISPDFPVTVFEVTNNKDTFNLPHLKFKVFKNRISLIIQEYNLQCVANIDDNVTSDNKSEDLLSRINSGDIRISNNSSSNEKELASVNKAFRHLLTRLNDIAGERDIKMLKLQYEDEIFKVITINAFKYIATQALTHVKIAICNPIITLNDENEKKEILRNFHDDPLLGGHAGSKRMLSKLKLYFKWRKMKKDVVNYIKSCELCKLNKPITGGLEKLIITPTPQKAFDLLIIDTIGPFPLSVKGYKYALTVICDLSKFLVAVPIPDKEAKTLARALFQDVFLTYGIPKIIRSDLGTEYKNSLFEELSVLLKYDHKMSTPYRHETVGAVERNHRIFNEYVRSYINVSMTDWDVWLKYFTYCYNTTPNSTHNYTPFELVFGKTPHLPKDILNHGVEPVYNVDNFAKEFKYRLQLSQKRAHELLSKDKEHRKCLFDRKARPIQIDLGDFVYIKSEARHKLEPWHKGPYEVVKIDNPNCVLKDGEKTFPIHKNRLRKR